MATAADINQQLVQMNINVHALLIELHQRNPNGSYRAGTRTIDPYTFRSDGHPAQCMYLYVKDTSKPDSKEVCIYSISDH